LWERCHRQRRTGDKEMQGKKNIRRVSSFSKEYNIFTFFFSFLFPLPTVFPILICAHTKVNYTPENPVCPWSRNQWIGHGTVIRIQSSLFYEKWKKTRLMDRSFCLVVFYYYYYYYYSFFCLVLFFTQSNRFPFTWDYVFSIFDIGK